MAFLLAILGGVVFGGATAAYSLSTRWKAQTEEVKEALNELASKHAEEQQENQDLKQKVADLSYQLKEAQKDLAASQGRS